MVLSFIFVTGAKRIYILTFLTGRLYEALFTWDTDVFTNRTPLPGLL